MQLNISTVFLGISLLFFGIGFSRIDASCFDWTGSVHSFGTNRNRNFVWSFGLDQLQFRFQFHPIDTCSLNNTENSETNRFNILLSDKSTQLVELETSGDNCSTIARRLEPTLYANLSLNCFNSKNGFGVILTFVHPTHGLNGEKLILKAQNMTHNKGIIVQTKAISFKNCPIKLEDIKLQLLSDSKNPNQKQNYRFNETVQIKCKKSHSLLFVTKNGKYSKLLPTPAIAQCNAFAQWSYEKPVRCWHGQIIHITGWKKKRAIAVADKPLIAVCENTNSTNIKSVKLEIGSKSGNLSSQVSWLNITLNETENEHHVTLASCIQYPKAGGAPYTKKVEILPKKIKFVEIRRHYSVRLGYTALIGLPVYTNFHLHSNHVVIEKNGDHKHVKSFFVATSKKDHHKHLIEVKFSEITEKDLGNYTAKVYIDKNEFDAIDFEIIAVDNQLSGGAIAAIIISVLLSCAIIAFCFGYFIRKFVKNQAKVVESDGERIMIIDDNDDDINDDVFHDPPRSARIQQELMRRSQEPTTSSAPEQVFDVPSTSHQDPTESDEALQTSQLV